MTTRIGLRIKAARHAKGFSQTELATKIGASSHSIISDYERGKRGNKRPDIQMLVKIADVLDVSIDYLFLGKNETKKS